MGYHVEGNCAPVKIKSFRQERQQKMLKVYENRNYRLVMFLLTVLTVVIEDVNLDGVHQDFTMSKQVVLVVLMVIIQFHIVTHVLSLLGYEICQLY